MHVTVPFTIGKNAWALQAVKLALAQDGVAAQFEHMTDGEAYYRLLKRLWTAGEGVITVEHDVVVYPGAIQSLVDCPEPWCTLPYYCSVGWIVDGLGATKFAAEFTREHPDFLDPPFPTCCNHVTNYCGLDRTITHKMEEMGLKPHVHLPGVVNLNQQWTV